MQDQDHFPKLEQLGKFWGGPRMSFLETLLETLIRLLLVDSSRSMNLNIYNFLEYNPDFHLINSFLTGSEVRQSIGKR